MPGFDQIGRVGWMVSCASVADLLRASLIEDESGKGE